MLCCRMSWGCPACVALLRIGGHAGAALAGPGDFQWGSQRAGLPLDSRSFRRPHPLCARGSPLGAAAAFRPRDYHATVPGAAAAQCPQQYAHPAQCHPAAAGGGAGEWAEAFEDLPRPRIAVIAGGHSGPFTLGPKLATRLATRASALARQSGGSLLVSTSSRTSDEAIDALQCWHRCPNYFYRWQPMIRPTPISVCWPARTGWW